VHLETGLNRLLAESLRRGRGEEASVHKSTPALKMDSTVRPLQRAGGNTVLCFFFLNKKKYIQGLSELADQNNRYGEIIIFGE
jgi:hypothetical protein